MCSDSMSKVLKPVGNVKTDYVDDVTEIVLAKDGFTGFFQNNRESQCPIQKCTLLESGCKKPYEGQNVKMGESAPYTISTQYNKILGFSENLCIQCTNGEQIVDQDEFKIEQISKCVSTLSNLGTAFPPVTIDHDDSSASH